MTNLFKDFHRLCDSESQIQAQDFTLKAENAALKEQVAQWETEYNGCSTLLNNAERTIETLEETIAQQAEAIRLKDEALVIAEIGSCTCCTKSYETKYHAEDCKFRLFGEALALQPSPEILQARDEKVAEACALLCHHEAHVMSAHGDSGVEGANWCGSQIRNGGWKEYL